MMEEVTQRTRSYREYLISSLQDSQEAAAYIETFLELEEDNEPKLLISALKDVIDARSLSNNLSEVATQSYEKLNKIVSDTGGAEIDSLIKCLDALGFRIVISLKDGVVHDESQESLRELYTLVDQAIASGNSEQLALVLNDIIKIVQRKSVERTG